jgi:hypothetical protein
MSEGAALVTYHALRITGLPLACSEVVFALALASGACSRRPHIPGAVPGVLVLINAIVHIIQPWAGTCQAVRCAQLFRKALRNLVFRHGERFDLDEAWPAQKYQVSWPKTEQLPLRVQTAVFDAARV